MDRVRPAGRRIGHRRGRIVKRRTGERAPSDDRSGFALYRAIRDARGLSAPDKSVLHTLATYADREGSCWPSVATIALGAGMDVSCAKRALARLTGRGVIELRRSAGGARWATSTRTINRDALRALADDGKGSRRAPTDDPSVGKGAQCAPPTGRGVRLNGARPRPPTGRSVRPKLTIQPTIELNMRTDHPDRSDQSPSSDGWMPEPGSPEPGAAAEPIESVRDALRAAGVRGPNLARLASAAGLTAAIVRDEHQSIKGARGVRNAPAMLFHRLAERFEVGSMRRDGPIGADTSALLARVKQQRRNRGIEPPGRN